jgi:Rad3-related DNA helicase
MDFKKYFPYDEVRSQQEEAINFSIEKFLNDDKKYLIIEAGTGVGKSAIAYTVSKCLDEKLSDEDGSSKGTWFVTTQKVLQDQYVKDYSSKGLKSIKSSSNYTCKFKRGNTCSDSFKELRAEEKGTKFWNACSFNCVYRKEKEAFLAASDSVTNYPYFLTEATYSGKISRRNLLVIDEAHNTETELSKFIEVAVTERFAKSTLKLSVPKDKTQFQTYNWIKDVYFPKLSSHRKHVKGMLEKYSGIKEKLKNFISLARQIELLDGHYEKFKRFLEIYDKENWVFDYEKGYGRKSDRIIFKPIDVSPYAEQIVFRLGRKILMMSATILDHKGFCESLGIPGDQVSFISLPSPFPVKNRPIFFCPIGKMSMSEIDKTLPKLSEGVKSILDQHKNEKGIIHAHSYKIANYLKGALKDKRILVHDSSNRDLVLRKHLKSKDPTVLLTPSMTEGIDLVGETSRFQVICKVPYPYLGDKLVKKRMNRWRWWYPLQTAKTVVQSVGRSVRNNEDHAVTYILDSDWERFYDRNRDYFPDEFKECLVK